MSHLSVRGEQSTSAEITALTNLAALATSGAGEFIKKTGATTFSNSTASGSGDVVKVGTPVDNQVGVWTGDGTIEGTSGLTYDGSNLLLTGDIGVTGTRITKGWFTNLEITNAPTVGGSAVYYTGGTDVALADGGTGASLSDPGADRIMAWDDSAGSTAFIAVADINTEAAPASGDFLLAYTAEGALVKVDWADLPAGGSGATTALDNLASVAINTSLISDTDNTDALGSASIGWSDLFLGSGAVINFNNGDVTLTHSAALLTLSSDFTMGGLFKINKATGNPEFNFQEAGTTRAKTYYDVTSNQLVFQNNESNAQNAILFADPSVFGGTIAPETTDGAALGTSTLMFSDLFLASGAVINFNNGDVTLTHTAENLTFAGGTLVVGTVDINGGAIDGTIIGAASAAAGTFTTIAGTTITASTGFALGDTDYIGITSNEILTFNAAGTIVVSGADFLIADGNGVVSGHSAQIVAGGITPEFQVIGTSTTGVDSTLLIANYSTTATSPATLMFAKSDQGTPGSFALLDSGDTIGGLLWVADDGVDLTSEVARIYAYIDNTSGSNDMPGRIVFSTAADGAAAVTDRLILDSAGVLKPATNDGVALGTTSLSYSDLFLASGAVINWNAGNTTLTHSTGLLTSNVPVAAPQIFNADNAIAASGNAATVTRAYRNNVVTNNSAATLTITMSTTSAAGGDMIIVKIVDFSAVAQTITWVNTENSTVTAPTTSNGSTTLPKIAGFMWNPLTSKWRCTASA